MLTLTAENFKIYTDPLDTVVSKHIREDKYWSQHEVDWIKKQNFKKPMDIGSHIGYFSIIMGLKKQSQAPVILVDASARNLSYAKKNMELNSINYIAINKAVVATDVSTVYFNQVKGNTGRSHLTHQSQKMQKVPAINILTLYNQYTPDFIKIDAEGLDWFLAAKLASVQNPPTLIIEHKNDGYITGFDNLSFTGGKVWDAVKTALNNYTAKNIITETVLTLKDLQNEPFLDIALIPKN